MKRQFGTSIQNVMESKEGSPVQGLEHHKPRSGTNAIGPRLFLGAAEPQAWGGVGQQALRENFMMLPVRAGRQE